MNWSSAEIGKRVSRAVYTNIATSIAKIDRKTLKRCRLDKFVADDILKYCFLYIPETRLWHSMQIVSLGDA